MAGSSMSANLPRIRPRKGHLRQERPENLEEMRLCFFDPLGINANQFTLL